ncbi:hydroxymethylglutaryl-CoA synthase [Aureococcus anophagefferens]|nr:hydroxymethylglutaryl-CoA synthase [Aureococcus anophagefferens]
MYAFKGREADDAKFALGRRWRCRDAFAAPRPPPCSAAHFARACDVRVERYGKPGYAPTGAAETDGAAPVPRRTLLAPAPLTTHHPLLRRARELGTAR